MTSSAKEALLALAERCEKAERDSFDLNHAIALQLGIASEPFTASLDAAMTLVPDGKRRIEFGTCEGGRAWAYVHTSTDVLGECDDAPTEAAAIVAAALRAQSEAGQP